MTKFDYSATAKRVTSREVAAARLTHDYAELVAHFGLDGASASTVLTDTARQIVIDGASRALTVDDLKGRDPGDCAVRPFWQAARAVRIGLVTAIGADKESKDVDWLRLVAQATANAVKHEVTAEAILAAVNEALNSGDED